MGVVLAIVAFLLGACTTATGLEPALPPFGQEAARVFDDSIPVAAFGDFGNRRAEEESKLRRAAQEADTIVLARVLTVARDDDGRLVRYGLTLQPQGDALFNTKPHTEILELAATPRGFRGGLLDQLDTELAGRELLLLLRTYEQDGEPRTHFRAEVPSQPVLEAIASARSEPPPPAATGSAQPLPR